MAKCFQPAVITLMVSGTCMVLVLLAMYGYLAYYVKTYNSQDLDKARDQELVRIENLMRAYDGLPPLPGGPDVKHYAFDHMAYSKRYPELQSLGTSETLLKKHWITKGLKAGYNATSNDECGRFDPVTYGDLHKDLIGQSPAKLLKHYLSTGINERRVYC